MNQSSRFWDRIAKRYAGRPVSDEASYQKKLEITREFLRSDMEVLEFGCGTGSTAIAHAPYVKHIRAIDISAKMLEIAQGKAASANVENITFEKGTIEDIGVSDQSLDAVLALSVLHLLKNREPVVARVYRALRPGGVFVSSTACIGGSMRFMKPILAIGRFIGLVPLVRFFTTKELQDSLTDAGFRIDRQWQPSKGAAVFIVASKAV